jgi:hypothetical protein
MKYLLVKPWHQVMLVLVYVVEVIGCESTPVWQIESLRGDPSPMPTITPPRFVRNDIQQDFFHRKCGNSRHRLPDL